MRPRVLVRSLILMLVTFAGILIFWYAAKPAPETLPDIPILEAGDNPYADLAFPKFTLTDRQGNPVDQSWMDGHYTVVDFFYTSCPLICPGMSAAMRELQNATTDTDLRLLSISIDPQVDTVPVIKRYAEGFKADPQRWKFTTGDMDMITIMLMGVNFDLGGLDTKNGFRNIDHPSSLILFGPDRRVIGLYRYSDPDEMAELVRKAHELAG